MAQSTTSFKQGQGGRKKGAQNKATKLIKEIFADTFNELQGDPKLNLLEWAKKNPTEFYKLAHRLIPSQVQLTGNVNITDEPVVFE